MNRYLPPAAAFIFIFLFTYTAVSKLYDINSFVAVLKAMPLISNYAALISYAIPVIELCITALLLFSSTRFAGLISASILMFLFTVILTFMFFISDDLPCSCGGVISKMTWPQHIVFNIVMFFIAVAAANVSRRQKQHSITTIPNALLQ